MHIYTYIYTYNFYIYIKTYVARIYIYIHIYMHIYMKDYVDCTKKKSYNFYCTELRRQKFGRKLIFAGLFLQLSPTMLICTHENNTIMCIYTRVNTLVSIHTCKS